jgi:hypothetical protein
MGSDGCFFRTPCFYVVTRNSQVSQQRRDPGTPCFYVVTQIPRSRNSGETWGTLCSIPENQQQDPTSKQTNESCSYWWRASAWASQPRRSFSSGILER